MSSPQQASEGSTHTQESRWRGVDAPWQLGEPKINETKKFNKKKITKGQEEGETNSCGLVTYGGRNETVSQPKDENKYSCQVQKVGATGPDNSTGKLVARLESVFLDNPVCCVYLDSAGNTPLTAPEPWEWYSIRFSWKV